MITSTAASLSSTVTGTAPLSFQWYFGMTAIAGATAAPWPASHLTVIVPPAIPPSRNPKP